MKRTVVLIFSCLAIPCAASAACMISNEACTCIEENAGPSETAMIQLEQKLLNLTPEASVFERTIPPSDAVPDVRIGIGAAKVLRNLATDVRYENIPQIVEEMEKAEKHLEKMRETYESIKKDYDRGLKNEKDLLLAENEIEDAQKELERLEEEYRIYSDNNLRISVSLKNGLLKLLDHP